MVVTLMAGPPGVRMPVPACTMTWYTSGVIGPGRLPGQERLGHLGEGIGQVRGGHQHRPAGRRRLRGDVRAAARGGGPAAQPGGRRPQRRAIEL